LARKPTAVAFDFPQDYPIRLLLDGHIAPTAEHVTHDVLLRAGVTLIEYLVNTSALRGPRTLLCAAPLKIPGADGAPARVFAIEGLGV
jgi:arylformamidase